MPSTASVEELYIGYATMVWRGLRRLGVPEASIEDAVQDVFLVAHRRLKDFGGHSKVTTWLYGIVLRVAKDYRRARSRHVNRVEGFADFLSASAEPARTPAEDAERREANRTLHIILGELAETHREVFVLVELEEVSVRDAAAALDLSVRSCQRKLRAAHAAFEKKLARHAREAAGRRLP